MAGVQLGALRRCREAGYHLIVEQLSMQDPNLGEAVRALAVQSSLHGLILTPPLCDAPAIVEVLKAERVPFVRIAPDRSLSGVPSVSIDDHAAAKEMTAYLIGLGHRRIGFIKGHPDHSAAHARFEGYRAALKQAGLPFVEELCAQGYFSYQSGMEAGEVLLALKNRPTAIFASNDDMAAAVLAAAQRFHLKLPAPAFGRGLRRFARGAGGLAAADDRAPADQGDGRGGGFASHPGAGRRNAPARRLGHALVVRQSTAPPGR